jgi:hypothetical protein
MFEDTRSLPHHPDRLPPFREFFANQVKLLEKTDKYESALEKHKKARDVLWRRVSRMLKRSKGSYEFEARKFREAYFTTDELQQLNAYEKLQEQHLQDGKASKERRESQAKLVSEIARTQLELLPDHARRSRHRCFCHMSP